MFGLGWLEVVILLLIGVIFIGPKELPGLLRTLTKFIRQISSARDDWMKVIHDDPSIREIRDSLDEARRSVDEPREKLEAAIREELMKLHEQGALDATKNSAPSPDQNTDGTAATSEVKEGPER